MDLRKGWAFLLLLLCPSLSHADQITSFQVSLIHPVQLFSDDYSVDGFRFNFLYGENQDLQGIDLGLINQTLGSTHGFELGAVNLVDQEFGGGQFGLFNEVKRNFKGVQFGAIANIAERSVEGFQAAVLYNDTQDDMHGVQLGIVNHAGSLNGLQIGFLNFNDDTKYMGFFPFINAAF